MISKFLLFKRKWAFILGSLALALLAISTQFAKSILFIDDRAVHADAIVVLGGESGDRAFKALELFKSGAAPYICVSGTNDGALIASRLVLAGVPHDHLAVEGNSRNTQQNAEYSLKILREHKCEKAIIVTSWYHSRRALACFKHYGRDIEFSSAPAYHGVNMDRKPSLAETSFVLHEYMGLVWYWVRYGIRPF